jgi:hypothetical protein
MDDRSGFGDLGEGVGDQLRLGAFWAQLPHAVPPVIVRSPGRANQARWTEVRPSDGTAPPGPDEIVAHAVATHWSRSSYSVLNAITGSVRAALRAGR